MVKVKRTVWDINWCIDGFKSMLHKRTWSLIFFSFLRFCFIQLFFLFWISPGFWSVNLLKWKIYGKIVKNNWTIEANKMETKNLFTQRAEISFFFLSYVTYLHMHVKEKRTNIKVEIKMKKNHSHIIFAIIKCSTIILKWTQNVVQA